MPSRQCIHSINYEVLLPLIGLRLTWKVARMLHRKLQQGLIPSGSSEEESVSYARPSEYSDSRR